MPNVFKEAGDEFVQSLARGLDVIRAFGPAADHLTIADVAKATGLTRAGARRILLTLQTLGYVQNDGRVFRLTARILELSNGYLAKPLWEVTRPVLHSLSKTINETVSAGVLDGHDIVYTVRIRSSRVLHLELREGARLPAHATTLGRTLLAALPELPLERFLRSAHLTAFTAQTVTDPTLLRKRINDVRLDGYCYMHDELEEGISGVAVPLMDGNGQTVAAINISLPTERTSVRKVKSTLVPMLQDTAARIHKELAEQNRKR